MLRVVPFEKRTLDLKADYVLTNPIYSIKQWDCDTVAFDPWALWRKN